MKTSNFDDLKLSAEDIFREQVETLKGIITFRLTGFDFLFNGQKYEQFDKFRQSIKLMKIDIDSCQLQLPDNKIINIYNLQEGQAVASVTPNDYYIIPSVKSKKLVKDIKNSEEAKFNYFYAAQLGVDRFKYDIVNQEGIHCIKGIKKIILKEEEKEKHRLKLACFKEIYEDDIIARICMLEKGQYIIFEFFTNDGTCAEMRTLY